MTVGRLASVSIALVVVAGCAGCPASHPASSATAPSSSSSVAPPSGACVRLCEDEAHCGSTDKTCADTCAKNARILVDPVVDAVVACRIETLRTSCLGPESAFMRGELLADERCFDEAATKVGESAERRRSIAKATCDRMLRCQGTGADVEQTCLDASMHPPGKDEQEAMRVIDALRDDVIASWSKCLAEAPCPAAGKPDSAADTCGFAALGHAQ